MSTNFNFLMECLFKVLGCVIAAEITYLIPKARKYLSRKSANEELIRLEKLIQIFAKSAEQQLKDIDEDGIKRKTYVEERLVEAGYILDAQIEDLIEKTVYDVNQIKVGDNVKSI